jgi:predicted Zn-ribbon and HTH transcriptional regulator
MIDMVDFANKILKMLVTPQVILDQWEEDKFLKEHDDSKKEDVSREVKCHNCGNWFKEINWHTPPSCPYCNRSRVD